jgi:hypothetical protein
MSARRIGKRADRSESDRSAYPRTWRAALRRDAIGWLLAIAVLARRADRGVSLTGGGGRAPVITDHMPASVNPTPCGSQG